LINKVQVFHSVLWGFISEKSQTANTKTAILDLN
jgi:hypothetical protein